MATSAVDLGSIDPGSLDTGSESVDTSTTESTEVDTGEGTDVSESGVDSGVDTGSGGGGDKVSPLSGKQIREAVNRLSQEHPEDAKILKQMADSHFRVESAYKSAFPTPAEATQAKQLIEAIGGSEGAATLQQRISDFDTQELNLEQGNPEVLDGFFKDFPEGAAALVTPYLEKLGASNPQALQAAIAPYAVNMLVGAGLGDHLAKIANATDPAQAKQLAIEAYNWLAGQSQNVQQLRQTRSQKDPGAERLAKDREAFNQEKENLFTTGVNERVNKQIETGTTPIVDKYAKAYKLNDTQKEHYKSSLQSAVVAEMKADQNYMRQVKLRYDNPKRSADSIAAYTAGEFNRRMAAKAFEVAKNIYGAPKGTIPGQQQGTGVVKAGSPKTAVGGGPIYVSQKPEDSAIDWTRPRAEIMFIEGRGYLKGSGRYVQWVKPAVQ
jgi:hypothetical protein